MTAFRFLLALLFLAASSTHAADKTDLWWNPAESGWGMTIANQGDTIFVTMYVYDAANNPTWFVGTANLVSTDAQGVNSYTGDWYRVNGPGYTAPTFDTTKVNATKVGTYTFQEFTATAGSIAYTVGDTTYTKTVQRQTLALNPRVNGSYRGWYFSTTTGCSVSSSNGNTASAINASLAGSGSSRQLGVSLTTTGVACSLSGFYAQAGRMGVLTGPWNCSNNGDAGNASFTEIEAGAQGLSARFSITYPSTGCKETGYLGTARVTLP